MEKTSSVCLSALALGRKTLVLSFGLFLTGCALQTAMPPNEASAQKETCCYAYDEYPPYAYNTTGLATARGSHGPCGAHAGGHR